MISTINLGVHRTRLPEHSGQSLQTSHSHTKSHDSACCHATQNLDSVVTSSGDGVITVRKEDASEESHVHSW